jgi:hypothetical protein
LAGTASSEARTDRTYSADDTDDTAGTDRIVGADDTDAPPADGHPTTRWVARAATLVAALPIAVAGVRGTVRGWVPTGDDGYSAVRAWDVLSTHLPLLGTWSSASTYTGHEINHPGPLQFDLLAVPVRLLGHDAGTSLGITAINAVSVVLVGWLLARRLGPATAALAMGLSALLSWSMGSEMLYDPWSQHAPLLPFALFLVAAWCALARDTIALPVLVVAGAYAFQTHLSYSLLVPGITMLVLAVLLARRQFRRVALTGAVGLLVWAQPLAEQLTGGGEGNIAGLLRSADHGMRTPGWGKAIRAFGGTIAVPPMWLPPSFGSPSFDLRGDGRPTGLAAGALVVLVAALATLGWRAFRRGSEAVAAGTAAALAGLALGFVTTLRMPLPLGMVPTYSRFMWPLGMVAWLALLVAGADEVFARRPRPARPALAGARWLAGAGLVVAVVAAAGALPTVDHSKVTPSWSMDAVRALDDDVVDAVDGAGGVLVDTPFSFAIGYVGPPLYSVLQEAGVPFYVEPEHLVRQLGESRRYRPGVARVRLIVRGGAAARAAETSSPAEWPGERLVASWSGLSGDEAAELDRLTARVRSIVAGHGLVLGDGAEDVLRAAGLDDLVDELAAARGDPDKVLQDGTVVSLWSGAPAAYVGAPMLDRDVFPTALMDRWADLADQAANQLIRIYVAPIP